MNQSTRRVETTEGLTIWQRLVVWWRYQKAKRQYNALDPAFQVWFRFSMLDPDSLRNRWIDLYRLQNNRED